MFETNNAYSSDNVEEFNVKVDLDFLNYCEFILNFSGIDSLYRVTGKAVEALQIAYPPVEFKAKVTEGVYLELKVGITEDECYGYLDNKLVDSLGNTLVECDAICSGAEEDYTNLSFSLGDRVLKIKLISGGFKHMKKLDLF